MMMIKLAEGMEILTWIRFIILEHGKIKKLQNVRLFEIEDSNVILCAKGCMAYEIT